MCVCILYHRCLQKVCVIRAYVHCSRTCVSLLVDQWLTFGCLSVLTRVSPSRQVAACGPFTTADNLEFEPLEALVGRVKALRPNLLILVTHPGPGFRV